MESTKNGIKAIFTSHPIMIFMEFVFEDDPSWMYSNSYNCSKCIALGVNGYTLEPTKGLGAPREGGWDIPSQGYSYRFLLVHITHLPSNTFPSN